MTTEDKIRLGRRAKELLANEAFQEVFDHLSAETVKQWRATPAQAAQVREHLFSQIAGMDAIKAQLETWVDWAEHAAQQIEKERERDERKANPFRLVRP